MGYFLAYSLLIKQTNKQPLSNLHLQYINGIEIVIGEKGNKISLLELGLLLLDSAPLEANEAKEVTDRLRLSVSLKRKFSSSSSPMEAISAALVSITFDVSHIL